jgi:hypothetical protein
MPNKLTSDHFPTSSRTPPLMIEIPVRTLKNVIVAVRDCFTGDLLQKAALVTVPEDAPRFALIKQQ